MTLIIRREKLSALAHVKNLRALLCAEQFIAGEFAVHCWGIPFAKLKSNKILDSNLTQGIRKRTQ